LGEFGDEGGEEVGGNGAGGGDVTSFNSLKRSSNRQQRAKLSNSV